MPARPARLFFSLTAGALGAAVLVTGTGVASAATPATDVGLFGVQDPTYDGVYRQGLAITGLVAAGKTPDANAVNWLLAQQCADGAFTAYRADTTKPCTAAQEDENATAMAIQALAALGKPTATAIAALKHFQLADGGFYDNTAFGAPASDANSTGLALSAFAATGVDPATITSGGKTGDDYLRSLQLPCASATGGGAFDFQAEKTLAANDYATVQATFGQLGKAFPLAPSATAATTPTCSDPTDAASSANAALAYLAGRLTSSNGAIPSSLGSGTDWTTTASAMLDLVAAGQGSAAVQAGSTALQANVKAYAQTGAGALGMLLLVAHATGVNPASYGGTDLAAALLATERTAAAPTPAPTATPTPTTAPTASGPTLPMTGAHGVVPLSSVGGALLVVGAAAVAFARRRRASGEAS
jgi:LPXTG-motif cell wall-anchored protein